MGDSYTRNQYIIIVLLAEKVIQHFFVTIAFYLDIGGIRSNVVPPWEILMVVGAGLGFLFLLSLIDKTRWNRLGLSLVGILALADIVGEFIAQGTMRIIITVSFIVAVILLVLVILEHRRNKDAKEQD